MGIVISIKIKGWKNMQNTSDISRKQQPSRPTLSGRFSLWVRQDPNFDYFAHQDCGNCLEGMPFFLLSFLSKEEIDTLTVGYTNLLSALEGAQSMQVVNHLLIDHAQKLAVAINAFLNARCGAIVRGINERRKTDGQQLVTWADIHKDILKGCLIKLLAGNDIEIVRQQAVMDHLMNLNHGVFIDMHRELGKVVQRLCAQEQSVKKTSASTKDSLSRPDIEHPGRYYRLF